MVMGGGRSEEEEEEEEERKEKEKDKNLSNIYIKDLLLDETKK